MTAATRLNPAFRPIATQTPVSAIRRRNVQAIAGRASRRPPLIDYGSGSVIGLPDTSSKRARIEA